MARPSPLVSMLLFLPIANVAAQYRGPYITGSGPDGSMGRPGEEWCNDGYGLFECTDPNNCTTITGEVSCCERSREAVASMLNEGNCGLQEQADGTCLTSIICAPLSTHYRAVIPMTQSHLTSHGLAVTTHTTDATIPTAGSTPTAKIPATGGMTGTTDATAIATAPSLYTTTEDPSLSLLKIQDHKPIEGSTIGGIVVGVLAGGSLLLLVLYLFLRRWKLRRDHRNPKLRGVLAGPRRPTGSTIPASDHRRDGSDEWHTPPKSEPQCSVGDLEANIAQQDVGLQYYSESDYSQTDGPASSKHVAKERTSSFVNGSVSSSSSPTHPTQSPTSPPWSADTDACTLHAHRSNATLDWPLPKSTVSSPALLVHTQDAQSTPQDPPMISPLSPLSPFADFDAVKEHVEDQAEKEQHRQDAYKKLSGEVAGTALTKAPGSVARARHNMVAAREAAKKPGSVAHARQNIIAVRGAAEAEQRRVDGPAREDMVGLGEFLRELGAQSDEGEVNETGTVIRRKKKRAC